jgi:hypothetical protein
MTSPVHNPGFRVCVRTRFCLQGTTLRAAEKLCFVSGHDFSRAVKRFKIWRALAPASLARSRTFPQHEVSFSSSHADSLQAATIEGSIFRGLTRKRGCWSGLFCFLQCVIGAQAQDFGHSGGRAWPAQHRRNADTHREPAFVCGSSGSWGTESLHGRLYSFGNFGSTAWTGGWKNDSNVFGAVASGKIR